MKLPYGYVLIGKEIVIHEEKADVVRSIFDDYLSIPHEIAHLNRSN